MSGNDIVIEAWNTVLFDKFVRFKHLLIAGLAGHSDELLSRGRFHLRGPRSRRWLRIRRRHDPHRPTRRP